MSIWEIVERIGALMGMASVGFILWDRFWRMTPTAVVVMRPFSKGGMQHLHLSIRNPADRPIIVRWKNGDRRGTFGIVEDTSSKSVVRSVVMPEGAVVVDAGETRDLPLHKPRDISEIDPDNYIGAVLWWRFAQPKLYKRDRRIPVHVTKRSMTYLDPEDYDILEDAAD